MTEGSTYDAVVVGSGPNGLAAAITVAREKRSVLLLEARETVGGGMRSAALTAPGFVHDVCSAVHPMGAASPFFSSLDLSGHGLEWVQPQVPLAHPLDDGTAVVLDRSLEATSESLGVDADAYRRLIGPLVGRWKALVGDLMRPLGLPSHPVGFAQFGLQAMRSAWGLSGAAFAGERARALFAGLCAHSMQPLERPFTASFGLVLAALGHGVGWPAVRGGSQAMADALERCLRSFGGRIETGVRVERLDDLPRSSCVLLDITPRQLLAMAEGRLSKSRANRLRSYRYGPGVFKLDWALDGPIPWRAVECSQVGSVHVGGTMEEIAGAEHAVGEGRVPEKPFVIVAQPSLFDPTRAPVGKHTAWAYCHVPNGSGADMTASIEAQIERFAPGFGDLVVARHAMTPAWLEDYNPNYVGGDIGGGSQDFWQLFARPALLWGGPYLTSIEDVYLCSSSTPPGGGVHGMCGYHAARAALRRSLR